MRVFSGDLFGFLGTRHSVTDAMPQSSLQTLAMWERVDRVGVVIGDLVVDDEREDVRQVLLV